MVELSNTFGKWGVAVSKLSNWLVSRILVSKNKYLSCYRFTNRRSKGRKNNELAPTTNKFSASQVRDMEIMYTKNNYPTKEDLKKAFERFGDWATMESNITRW